MDLIASLSRREVTMEISIKREEKQKETPAEQAADDTVSQNKNARASMDQESGARTHPLLKDPRAAQKLARKKKMRAAHRRRLKASYASG
jgi:hypothetical protein